MGGHVYLHTRLRCVAARGPVVAPRSSPPPPHPHAGLAWAIAEHLAAETRCFTLFATHFHELTALALTNPAVGNRHVSALVEPGSDSITMLFEVRAAAVACLEGRGGAVANDP